MRVALTQFYALVLYPHIVHSAYGDRLDADFTEQLITTGVDMFLNHYRAARTENPAHSRNRLGKLLAKSRPPVTHYQHAALA
ncbi:hypothetical protein B1L11_13585 [Microbispora sp. GKU 823]|nr:hypothetical protein B1L11_13585 [Microbispora sp. GKU 823]